MLHMDFNKYMWYILLLFVPNLTLQSPMKSAVPMVGTPPAAVSSPMSQSTGTMRPAVTPATSTDPAKVRILKSHFMFLLNLGGQNHHLHFHYLQI